MGGERERERVKVRYLRCFHRGYTRDILKVHFLRTLLRNDLSSNKIGGSISGEVVNCGITVPANVFSTLQC